MAPKLAPTPFVAGVKHSARRHMATIAGVAHGASEIVIVGELVGQDGETADLFQNLAAQRHRGAETRVGHAQPHPGQDIGEELIVDPHRR